MKILAIDPGYERLGIAILEKGKTGNETLIHSECFKTLKEEVHEERLLQIGQKIKEVIKKYTPEALSIESLFFNTNQKTATKVSEARGIIIHQAKEKGLEVKQFTPLQIKTAITGYGRSDKTSVMKMVPKLIKIEKNISSDDEMDAIAVGLTFFANNRGF